MTRLRRGVIAALVVMPLAVTGCGSVALGPTYSPDELAWQCVRNGGVWRSYVGDGYCEIQSPGFMFHPGRGPSRS